MSAPRPELTLGVFDSGFGGLTVLRALLPLFPGARFLYLGDTARLPYGAKSRDTVVRYALSSAQFLLQQGVDLLVVACNTASALALSLARGKHSKYPEGVASSPARDRLRGCDRRSRSRHSTCAWG